MLLFECKSLGGVDQPTVGGKRKGASVSKQESHWGMQQGMWRVAPPLSVCVCVCVCVCAQSNRGMASSQELVLQSGCEDGSGSQT